MWLSLKNAPQITWSVGSEVQGAHSCDQPNSITGMGQCIFFLASDTFTNVTANLQVTLGDNLLVSVGGVHLWPTPDWVSAGGGTLLAPKFQRMAHLAWSCRKHLFMRLMALRLQVSKSKCTSKHSWHLMFTRVSAPCKV